MSPNKQPTGLALAWCSVPPRCTKTGKSLTSNGWCLTPPVIVTKRNGYDISVGLVTKLHESDFYFYPRVQIRPWEFPAACPVGVERIFLGGNAAWA
jgi:hypothetical protein